MATALRLSPGDAPPVQVYARHQVARPTREISKQAEKAKPEPRELLRKALSVLRETQQELLRVEQNSPRELRLILKSALKACGEIEADVRTVVRERSRFLGREELK